MPGIVPRVCRNGALRFPTKYANYMIIRELNNVPCFLARWAKAFGNGGLAHLVTGHSQTYPQFLGISCHAHDLRGLPASGGRGRMLGY